MTFNGAFNKDLPDLFTSSQHLLIAQRIESGHQLAEDLAKGDVFSQPNSKGRGCLCNFA